MPDFAQQRLMMVDAQVRTNDVTDARIHGAMLSTPREAFVPDAKQAVAYMDGCVALGDGRALADPRSFAKLAQLAGVKSTDRVLDVGCASGYSAAVLGRLAREVVALERNTKLAGIARDALRVQANVRVVEGDLPAGAAGQGPFDVIFINGALEVRPDALLDQLAEGGRLVCVQRTSAGSAARLYVRHEGAVSERAGFDAQLPVLPGFEKRSSFVF